MAHPEIDNHTRLAHAMLPLIDEAGMPVLVPLVQACFHIAPDGALTLADPQPAVALGGIEHEPPGENGWRMEPQAAFFKPGCDVVVNGHALAPHRGASQMLVEVAVGKLVRRALVLGPRHLLRGSRITAPEPFERVPLLHSEAFGGWDRRNTDPQEHRSEPRNPAGRGFRDPRLSKDAEVSLPAIEDPARPIQRYGDQPEPVGFGFVPAHWLGRTRWAGTYDSQWQAQRMPLLPTDFDRRFFLAASPGLVQEAAFVGGEPVRLGGLTASGPITFRLPSLGTVLCNLHLRGQKRQALKMQLDTVVIDTDAMQLLMLWRAHWPARLGLHTLQAAQFHLPDLAAAPWVRRGRGPAAGA